MMSWVEEAMQPLSNLSNRPKPPAATDQSANTSDDASAPAPAAATTSSAPTGSVPTSPKSATASAPAAVDSKATTSVAPQPQPQPLRKPPVGAPMLNFRQVFRGRRRPLPRETGGEPAQQQAGSGTGVQGGLEDNEEV